MEQAPFDALVAAYEPGPGPGGLRALEPLAGRALVEHQLRRALAAGADRLLLLVDEVPVELATLITALRREGVQLQPVAGLDVAAEAVAPERPVLLMADACLPEETVVRRLAVRGPACLATLPDAEANARYERIDAGERWAGVAMLDGARVAEAAAMLGSWDPVSTLLRRAVQEGAERLDVAGSPPTLLLDGSEVAEAEDRIIISARPAPRSWAERWITGPLVRLVVPPLLARGVAPELLAWPGAILALAASVTALAGGRWPALVALLLAVPLLETGRQLARIGDRPLALDRLLGLCLPVGGALAVVGLGQQLMVESRQWGWALVALLLVGVQMLGALLRPLAEPRPLWLARTDALAWATLPFALVGRWDAGLAGLLLYAGASTGFLLRRVLARAAADAGLDGLKLF